MKFVNKYGAALLTLIGLTVAQKQSNTTEPTIDSSNATQPGKIFDAFKIKHYFTNTTISLYSSMYFLSRYRYLPC